MERQIATTPIPTMRSRRRDEWRGLTSMKAGVIVPVAYFPLLREDAIRGRVSLQIRMAEAVQTIINPIRVRAQAHLVPKVALSRFEGSMETLNRSYGGVATLPGGATTPAWFVKDTTVSSLGDDDKGHQIYDALGVHYKSATWFNTDLLESYWRVVNWRRASVSSALTPISLQSDFAPAFWDSWKFDMVKPSFDAAMMEGVVPLNVSGTPIIAKALQTTVGSIAGLPTNTTLNVQTPTSATDRQQLLVTDVDGSKHWITTDITGQEFQVSLANIAMATKTAQFAKMRERYQGIPDEYLINLLMQGIRVPPEDLREPILLGRAESVIGQVERYATDGASLDQSVTRGMSMLSIPFATPAINPGGIVIVTVEIVPEQLYERTTDYFLHADTIDDLPNYMEDYLDPQKVVVVENKFADTFHSAPTGVFGYAPLNHEWQRHHNRVGGRLKRPVPDSFVEDRQRIWKVEKADPKLTADFYVCPQPFPHDNFADTSADPFEVICIGQADVSGLTVFGGAFEEDGDHYEKIMAEIDTGRITSVPPAVQVGGEEEAVIESEGENVETA